MEESQPFVKINKGKGKFFEKFSALLTKSLIFLLTFSFSGHYNEPHRKRRCLIPGAFSVFDVRTVSTKRCIANVRYRRAMRLFAFYVKV